MAASDQFETIAHCGVPSFSEGILAVVPVLPFEIIVPRAGVFRLKVCNC
jgi:hypothetical protein